MGDGNSPPAFGEHVSGQEGEVKEADHENNSDDVPRHSQAEHALSEGPGRKRKRKTSRPQRYQPKREEEEEEEETADEGREADLFVVVSSNEIEVLAEPDCDENVRRKRSERLKEQRAKLDSQPVPPPEPKLGCVVRSRKRKKRKRKWYEEQSTCWKPSLTTFRGLVLTANLKTPSANTDKGQVSSSLENGQLEGDDQLRPWESSTLPLYPVRPYRVYAPIFVPDIVEAVPVEPVNSSIGVKVNGTEESRSRPILIKQPETLETTYPHIHTVASSLGQSCGETCYPMLDMVIAKHSNLAALPSVEQDTHAISISPTVLQGTFLPKRTSKEYMRSKRSDPNFRAAEVKLTRERMQRARQDPEYREKERARHREQQRARRADPQYAAKVREKQRERHRMKRLQSTTFRHRERERQREYMRAKRADPEYREKERNAKRSRKENGDYLVEDSTEPSCMNTDMVYGSQDASPDKNVASEAGDGLKAYWDSQVGGHTWTMANPDNQTVLSHYGTTSSTSSSFSSLREAYSNSNLNTFSCSPSIRYIQYDADRDSDGAGGCRIGSSHDSSESPCTFLVDNSGVSVSGTSTQDSEPDNDLEQFQAADHREQIQNETVSRLGMQADETTCSSAVGVGNDIDPEVMRAGRVMDGVTLGVDLDP